jgi:hypothetical protein
VALRALVAAHAQSAWNRGSLRLSRMGRTIAVILLVFAWLTGTSAFSLGAFGMGWVLGSDWDNRLTLGSLILFALSWGIGALFGLTGGGRLLEVGQLRQFPVRPITILFAELAARLAEPVTAVVAVTLFAMHVGIASARPELLPSLLLIFPLNLFVMLSLQFILGELVGALARRIRIAFGFLILLAMGLSPRAALLFGKKGPTFERFEHVETLAKFLPTHTLLTAVSSASLGEWASAARLTALSLIGPAVLLAAGIWVMGREQSARTQESGEKEGRLWTFSTPAAGIARMHLAVLFRTPVGRYSLVAPLFAMILIPGLVNYLFGVQRAALAVFIYAALGSVQFHFNSLGFDGPSVAELFRLPLTARALLWGKTLANMALALVEGAVLALFLRLSRDEPLDSCLTGLFLFLTINLLMGALGRYVSVQWPRALPKKGMRGVAAPLPVILINLFGTAVIGGGMGALHYLFQHTFGAYAPLAALGLTTVSVAVSLASLPGAAVFLDHRREAVLLAMR